VLQSNNITLRRSICGSPSKKLKLAGIYTDKYWNKSLTTESEKGNNDERKEDVFIDNE
jgi:hypothetical protein